jgi:hypothetical protein
VTTPAEKTNIDTVLSSATLIMGPTHSGKTSLLATFAEYVWKSYQKVTLGYVVDGGGIPPHLQALVNRGIVRIWKMRTRSAPGLAQETCERAAMGWWPRKINPKTGEVEPNVQLVPSIVLKFTLRCPAGHDVKSAPAPAGLQVELSCPTCNMVTSLKNGSVHKSSSRTKGFEQVGAIFYEGATSICSWLLDDMSARAGRGELGGEKGAIGTIVSGDMAFGGTNRAMYGTIQQRIEAMVLNSNSIQNLVIPPVWTALLLEASDEGGLSIAGPQLSGQAKTGAAPQWFGDCLETVVHQGPDGKRYRRIMLQPWTDARGVRHLCGVRSFPSMLPAMLEEEEATNPSEAFREFNLGHFYSLREDARRHTEERYAELYPDAPGLPEGDMEYGEAVVSGPVAGPSVAPVTAGPKPGSAAARALAAKAPAVPVAPAAPVVPPVAVAPVPGLTSPPGITPATPTSVPTSAPVPAVAVTPASSAPPDPAGPSTPVDPNAPVVPLTPVVTSPTPPAPGSAAARARAAATKGASGALVAASATSVAAPAPAGAPTAAPAPVASPMATGPASAVPPTAPPPPPVRAAIPPPPGRRPGGARSL